MHARMRRLHEYMTDQLAPVLASSVISGGSMRQVSQHHSINRPPRCGDGACLLVLTLEGIQGMLILLILFKLPYQLSMDPVCKKTKNPGITFALHLPPHALPCCRRTRKPRRRMRLRRPCLCSTPARCAHPAAANTSFGGCCRC